MVTAILLIDITHEVSFWNPVAYMRYSPEKLHYTYMSKGNNSYVRKWRLLFLCRALFLIDIYTPIKFHVWILYSFWDIALTNFMTDWRTMPFLYTSYAFGGGYRYCVQKCGYKHYSNKSCICETKCPLLYWSPTAAILEKTRPITYQKINGAQRNWHFICKSCR